MSKFNQIYEEFVDALKEKDNYIEIFKNPSKSELNDLPSARGWISPNGDLYLISNSNNLIHFDLMKILYRKKIKHSFNPGKDFYEYYATTELQSPIDVGINVQLGKENNLYIGESYAPGHFKSNYYSVFTKIWNKAQKKNKGIIFHDVKI